MKLKPFLSGCAVACLLPFSAQAQSVTTDGGTISVAKGAEHFAGRGYSPYAGRSYPTHVYWGDQHLHTSWSPDAGGAGTRLDPADALRFARGEQVISNTGIKAQLARPLDWIAVTDHSDAMGIIADVIEGDPGLMSDPILKQWNKQFNQGGEAAMAAVMDMITLQGEGRLPPAVTDPKYAYDAWHRYTTILEAANDPGNFTSFIAYEWTSNYGGGNNLHRNVIYRDGKDLADRVAPLTTFVTENPEGLWEWMQGFEDDTGGSVLAIPHNGNLSNGLMFALTQFDGSPIDADWAKQRARWEPLYEITQSKGTSEQHPTLAPTDEFLNFEIWDKGNLNVVPKTPGMINTEYVREALKNGMAIEAAIGVNPFQYGIVGGTDHHTGMTAPEENNFFGKFPSSEPSAERWSEDAFNFDGRVVKGWELGASGWTGIWARENTRAALWDALKRREAYGTTGPRITVRFFGGYGYTPEDALGREPARIGYEKGVPMGATLGATADGSAPSFLVAALKDPLSGNLDRIQVVKGWVDAAGDTQEQVYDVVWSDAQNRVADASGKIPPVGNTVDVKRATWTNTIGAPELITVWQDPDFDPALRAFYYARVLEIPTPRWTAFDAAYYGLEMGPEVPMTLQERAYTSPIWYQPD